MAVPDFSDTMWYRYRFQTLQPPSSAPPLVHDNVHFSFFINQPSSSGLVFLQERGLNLLNPDLQPPDPFPATGLPTLAVLSPVTMDTGRLSSDDIAYCDDFNINKHLSGKSSHQPSFTAIPNFESWHAAPVLVESKCNRTGTCMERLHEVVNKHNQPVQVSKGSNGHPYSCADACKFASKARGCRDGTGCDHCHLCRWFSPSKIRCNRGKPSKEQNPRKAFSSQQEQTREEQKQTRVENPHRIKNPQRIQTSKEQEQASEQSEINLVDGSIAEAIVTAHPTVLRFAL